MPTSGLRVTPRPPLAVQGLAAAPEIAMAVGRVNSLPEKPLVGCQPVALLPQYSGDRMKLSPPRRR